jgi:hypothetical protein
VEDIAQVLIASIRQPNPGRVYNVCDDDPAPPQDVIAHAAALLGLPPPPEIPFEKADLSPMARSFYAESKRVRNDRIKRELGVRLRYPDYRSGLAQLLSAETRRIVLPPAGKLLYSGAKTSFKGSTGHETLPHVLLFGAVLLRRGCSKFVEYTGRRSPASR